MWQKGSREHWILNKIIDDILNAKSRRKCAGIFYVSMLALFLNAYSYRNALIGFNLAAFIAG